MDRGAWWVVVHGVATSQAGLNDFTFTFHFQQEGFYFLFTFCHKGGVICISEVIDISPSNLVEKAMAPHSSTLPWKIPWTEEPRRLQSMGLLRVGHDSVTSLSLFTFMHWRRRWWPTPVFLPGESQGRRRLVGCRLWGRTKLDTTEAT